jgi:hypothetical protein
MSGTTNLERYYTVRDEYHIKRDSEIGISDEEEDEYLDQLDNIWLDLTPDERASVRG